MNNKLIWRERERNMTNLYFSFEMIIVVKQFAYPDYIVSKFVGVSFYCQNSKRTLFNFVITINHYLVITCLIEILSSLEMNSLFVRIYEYTSFETSLDNFVLDNHFVKIN